MTDTKKKLKIKKKNAFAFAQNLKIPIIFLNKIMKTKNFLYKTSF